MIDFLKWALHLWRCDWEYERPPLMRHCQRCRRAQFYLKDFGVWRET